MLLRFCTTTLLLLAVACGSYEDCVYSECEFHSEVDGMKYTTRVTFKLGGSYMDGRFAIGFTTHTINPERTLVSRVNVTFSASMASSFFMGKLQSDPDLYWFTNSPFVKDFWLGNSQYINRLSVQVYNNISLKPSYVSKLRGRELKELEITGNNWRSTSGLAIKVRGLKKLILSNNQIEKLNKGLVNGCHNLEVLDLSRNKIVRIGRIIYYINNYLRETIKEVNLANNMISDIRRLHWGNDETPLKKLNFSYNQIRLVHLHPTREISEIDLSFNNISAIPTYYQLLDLSCFLRVDRIVLARQKISSLIEVEEMLSNIDYKLCDFSILTATIMFPLMFVPQSQCNISRNFIYCNGNGSNILPSPRATLYYLTGNPMKNDRCSELEIWAEERLDLSHNDLTALNESVPRRISGTKKLNLSWNNISYISEHFFKEITLLTDLDLSHNHLKHVHLALYSQLLVLDISNNYLNTMNIYKISSQYSIEYLNLSHNSFTNILEVEWSQFKQFSKVDLGENNLECCSPEGQFSRIMYLRHHDKILNINSTKALSCVTPHNRRVELTNAWLSEDHCHKSFKGWVAFGCLLLLTPLLIHIVELLDYFTHQAERDLAERLTHLKEQGLVQDEIHALECDYDVFVCHSHKDFGWVHHELIPNLETDRDGHRVCAHYRDFPLGSLIEENIEMAMNKSRKVIVVVTKAFLESYWCKMELTYAWTKMVSEGRNYIIVIELERMPKDIRPPILCYLMQSRTYLEWPEEPTDDVKQNCWRRVRKALGKSLRDRKPEQQDGTESIQID